MVKVYRLLNFSSFCVSVFVVVIEIKIQVFIWFSCHMNENSVLFLWCPVTVYKQVVLTFVVFSCPPYIDQYLI